jgi:hypothetical protein
MFQPNKRDKEGRERERGEQGNWPYEFGVMVPAMIMGSKVVGLKKLR